MIQRNCRTILTDAWNVSGAERKQQAHAHKAEGQAQQATTEGKGYAFRQHLPDDVAAAGAQSGTGGQLAFAAGGAHEQKVGHIRAGDKQDQTNRSQQDQQGRTSVANYALFQGNRAEAVLRVERARISAAILLGGKLQLGIGHGQRNARFEPGCYYEVIGHVLRREIELIRQPEIPALLGNEAASDYAHHLIALAVKLDISADDVLITAEAALPQSVAEDNHMAAMRAILGGGEGAAREDGCAQQAKIIAGHMDALHLLRLPAAGEVESGTSLVVSGDILENAGLLMPDIELGHAGAPKRSLRPGFHQLHQRLRLGIGERLQQH